MLDNYPDTFSFVQIHRGDDYETSWANARANFYTDFSGYPNTWFDGHLKHSGSHTYALYLADYNSCADDPTDVTIEVTGDYVSGTTFDIQATICIEAGGEAKSMRIYMVQVLDDWPIPPSYSRNGFKQAAATQDISIGAGQCATVERTFTFDSMSWANQDDIKIIVWAQEPQSSSPPTNRAYVFQSHTMTWPFPPSGPADDCLEARPADDGVEEGSTVEATNDGSAGCGMSNTSPDVWYTYTAKADGTLYVDTCGSMLDTVLSVHTGCPGTAANELACNDDSDVCAPGSTESYLELPVLEGETYVIRVAGNNDAVGDFVLHLTGPADITPPTPDPMEFEVLPAGLSYSEIGMTAVEAVDAGSPAIQYYFHFVSGGTGGTSSEWQASREYADLGLEPNTAYTYEVKARDGSGNETAYSDPATGYTLAQLPGRPVLTVGGSSSLDLDIDPAGNPTYTEFAIKCAYASGDPAWNGQWVDELGMPAGPNDEDAVWQSLDTWGTATVNQLLPETTYCFGVKARNVDLVETSLGQWACATTESAIGDLNCDGAVNNFDISPFVLVLTSTPPDYPQYYDRYPYCNHMFGDINEDGSVNNFDISPFVDLITR